MNYTGVEHDGQTYPAGAVFGGKLLICETKQSVCIISEETHTHTHTQNTRELRNVFSNNKYKIHISTLFK